MTAGQWTSLIQQALWPVVILTLGLVLRDPIAAFLGGLAGRVTKVSVMSVSVELAVAQATDPPWLGGDGNDVRGLLASQEVNSHFAALGKALQAPDTADYFVVDLRRDGDEWLTSRLYLFSYLLSRLKGVRAIVFVATRGDVAGSFLAVGSVAEVMRTLGSAQPWLREARLESEANQVGRLPNPAQPPLAPIPAAAPPSVPADVDEWWERVRAGLIHTDPLHLARQFLERLQWPQPTGMADPDGDWLRLPDQPGRLTTWEHATWLRLSDLIDGMLRNSVQPESWVVDDRSWTSDRRIRNVATAPGDYVALLSPSRRFDRLIDRRSLLQTVGETCTASISED